MPVSGKIGTKQTDPSGMICFRPSYLIFLKIVGIQSNEPTSNTMMYSDSGNDSDEVEFERGKLSAASQLSSEFLLRQYKQIIVFETC